MLHAAITAVLPAVTSAAVVAALPARLTKRHASHRVITDGCRLITGGCRVLHRRRGVVRVRDLDRLRGSCLRGATAEEPHHKQSPRVTPQTGSFGASAEE